MSQLDLLGAESRPSGTRDALDRYYTPTSITDGIMARILGDLPLGRVEVLEPCAGQMMAMARALGAWSTPARDLRVWTSDIDEEAPTHGHADALDTDWQGVNGGRRWDLIITNPPFCIAAELVRHLAPYCDRLAMLVRLSFLEPEARREDLITGGLGAMRLTRLVVTPRVSSPSPSGETRGSDSVTTAWLVWARQGAIHPPDVITRDELENLKIARSTGDLGLMTRRGR